MEETMVEEYPEEMDEPVVNEVPLAEEKKFFASLARKREEIVPDKEETDPYVLFIKDKFGGREI